MNTARRNACLLAARYAEEARPSEAGYLELMALVTTARSEEYLACKNLARYRDKDERSAGYHDVAMEAFPLLKQADEELKRGLELGEWEPEIVINSLRAAANATGAKPVKPARKTSRKGLRKARA